MKEKENIYKNSTTSAELDLVMSIEIIKLIKYELNAITTMAPLFELLDIIAPNWYILND